MDLENKVNETKVDTVEQAIEPTEEMKKEEVKSEIIRGISYRKLEPSAKNCMRISSIIVLGLLLIPGAVLCILLRDDLPTAAIIAYGISWILSITYIIAAPKVRYERYRYNIDETVIRVRSGLFWVSEEIVPMERLHKLETSQGPIDRIFKLSKLTVTTAGGDVTIKFLKDEQAAEIAEALKKKINDIAIAERMK